MFGRITNQMSSSMTLAGIESALDRLDTTQQELSTRQADQPALGRPVRHQPHAAAQHPAVEPEHVLEQHDGRHRLGAGEQLRDDRRHQHGSARSASSRSRPPTARRARGHAGLGPGGQPADRRDQAGREHPVQRPVRVLGLGHRAPRPTSRAQTTRTPATPARSAARSAPARRSRSTRTSDRCSATARRHPASPPVTACS